MDMVERVARAIEKLGSGPLGMPIYDTDYTAIACAAIEAMREPTEAMLEAGGGSIACVSWPAMIDVALTE